MVMSVGWIFTKLCSGIQKKLLNLCILCKIEKLFQKRSRVYQIFLTAVIENQNEKFFIEKLF